MNYLTVLPMTNFTQEEIKPSEQTLAIIRQMAYSFNFLRLNSVPKQYCLS